MALTKTPICDFGKNADDFRLKSTDNKILSLNELKGEKGTLIMFICNHCPYVKAVIKDIVEDAQNLKTMELILLQSHPMIRLIIQKTHLTIWFYFQKNITLDFHT